MDLSSFQMLTFILHNSIITSLYGWGFLEFSVKLSSLPKVTQVELGIKSKQSGFGVCS